MGKAAFLQAVTKQSIQPGGGNSIYDGGDNLDGPQQLQQPQQQQQQQHTPPERTSFTIQHHTQLNNDIAEDLRIHHVRIIVQTLTYSNPCQRPWHV